MTLPLLLMGLVSVLLAAWLGYCQRRTLDEVPHNRGRKRLDCPCCQGYPVCWVERQAWGYPAQRLCSRHTVRWAHIRDLEDDVLADLWQDEQL